MGDPDYIAGDFWRICERCGFKVRSSQTIKTWDGLWVCRDDYESRHPQDFVRGVADRIAIPEPRPEQVNSFIGPLTGSVSASASPGAVTISVDSSVRFGGGDHIGIGLDDGSIQRVVVQSVPSPTSLLLATGLQNSISSGNVVINYSAVSEPDIG